MQLDRHEKHVLREMNERYGLPVGKLLCLADKRRVSVEYNYSLDGFIACIIQAQVNADKSIGAYGEAAISPVEPKPRERLGRMIAFARAVCDFYQVSPPRGYELENIARGVCEL